MLKKTPKPVFWKFIKGSAKTLFVIEAVCFAVSYGIYYRMNTNRDFRLYINNNFPVLLDGYYKLGEFFGESKQRQIDLDFWENIKESTKNVSIFK
ncbi:uncharacterized protein LOC129605304 [Condylostylus longicornis]|uniref:uncharacterized protein LOC129605304 n=1 Tax=Condylostylus longicornis TaxID=2530218 RepID=UPI00244DFFAD|nr:uncharacterized protein LOC129605304 [Condylostylus longicornis]XP_055370965.1 uncharacterized protein LOC129605304 [Condylostylus longicornis]XP_055370973.1 uncharacterized protein LOC129605304 [Condylostylus longicornis]